MAVNGRWPQTFSVGFLTLLVVAACSNEPPAIEADSAPSQTAAAISAEVMSAVSDNLETVETLLPGGVVVVRVGAKAQSLVFGEAETRPKRAMGKSMGGWRPKTHHKANINAPAANTTGPRTRHTSTPGHAAHPAPPPTNQPSQSLGRAIDGRCG